MLVFHVEITDCIGGEESLIDPHCFATLKVSPCTRFGCCHIIQCTIILCDREYTNLLTLKMLDNLGLKRKCLLPNGCHTKIWQSQNMTYYTNCPETQETGSGVYIYT